MLEKTLTGFLNEVAARTPAPGGGAVAAVAAALAAALVEMAARFSDDAPAAGQAESLRGRLLALAREDAEAYEAVLASRGDARIEALSRAADVPLDIAEGAVAVAALAAELVKSGNPNLREDARTAALLAEAATKSAAKLVEVNLANHPRDERVMRARSMSAWASQAARRALASAS